MPRACQEGVIVHPLQKWKASFDIIFAPPPETRVLQSLVTTMRLLCVDGAPLDVQTVNSFAEGVHIDAVGFELRDPCDCSECITTDLLHFGTPFCFGTWEPKSLTHFWFLQTSY